jgi:hypothetical protein
MVLALSDELRAEQERISARLISMAGITDADLRLGLPL